MRPIRVALIIALLVAAAACGGDEPGAISSPTPTITATDPPTTTTSPTANPAGPNSVAVIDNSFDPPELTVTVGTEVVWTQTGTSTHTVTASDGSFRSHPNCSTDLSACMKQGETFRHTFTTAGRFTYACDIHGPLMSGAIVVQ